MDGVKSEIVSDGSWPLFDGTRSVLERLSVTVTAWCNDERRIAAPTIAPGFVKQLKLLPEWCAAWFVICQPSTYRRGTYWFLMNSRKSFLEGGDFPEESSSWAPVLEFTIDYGGGWECNAGVLPLNERTAGQAAQNLLLAPGVGLVFDSNVGPEVAADVGRVLFSDGLHHAQAVRNQVLKCVFVENSVACQGVFTYSGWFDDRDYSIEYFHVIG